MFREKHEFLINSYSNLRATMIHIEGFSQGS